MQEDFTNDDELIVINNNMANETLADWYFDNPDTKEIKIEYAHEDANGKIINKTFVCTIRKPLQTDISQIRNKCLSQHVYKDKKTKRQVVKHDFNDALFNVKLIKEYLVSPNLNNADFLRKNGVSCIEDYLNKVLPKDIFEELADEIYNFGRTFKNNDELETEITKVKN